MIQRKWGYSSILEIHVDVADENSTMYLVSFGKLIAAKYTRAHVKLYPTHHGTINATSPETSDGVRLGIFPKEPNSDEGGCISGRERRFLMRKTSTEDCLHWTNKSSENAG